MKFLFMICISSIIFFNTFCSPPDKTQQISKDQKQNNTFKDNIDNKFNCKILGLWERVGDENEGIIIKVVQIQNEDSYIGRIQSLPKDLREIIKIGEVYWQNLTPKNNNLWEGTITRKQKGWGDVSSKYYKAKFLLINDNLLEIYTKEQTQKYLRKTNK